MQDILREIEAFCEAHDIKASRLGREAVKDTTFVSDLRSGREPRSRVVARVREYMARVRAEKGSSAVAS